MRVSPDAFEQLVADALDRLPTELGAVMENVAVLVEVWPTSEHYFQAQKFQGQEHRERIRVEPSPMIAARMGRDRAKPLRPDWEN